MKTKRWAMLAGGIMHTTPAGPRSDQRAEFVARLHILQAAREEAGQMLADHRIGCVGQAEFLQSGPPCLARQVVESGPGEEPVEDDLRQRGAIERRGNCLGGARLRRCARVRRVWRNRCSSRWGRVPARDAPAG